MTEEQEISVLADAIKQLQAELRSSPTKARREEIMELLQIAKAMRVAIIAKEGLSPPTNSNAGGSATRCNLPSNIREGRMQNPDSRYRNSRSLLGVDPPFRQSRSSSHVASPQWQAITT